MEHLTTAQARRLTEVAAVRLATARQTIENAELDPVMAQIERIHAKAPEDWTPSEQAFMGYALEWSAAVVRSAAETIRPVLDSLSWAVTEDAAPGRSVGSIRVPLAELVADPLDDAMELAPPSGWLPPGYAPPDASEHLYEGLPGLATYCWADVWDEPAQRYRVCNAEADASSDMGTCTEHLAQMRGETQP